jgi:hypothetical protein
MMKTGIQTIAVFIIVLFSTGPLYASDLKDGFLDTGWQTDLSNSSNFLKIEEKEDLSYFVNPTVKYVINEIQIPKVVYGAYKNKFFAVYIDIEEYDVYRQIKKYITQKYGKSKNKMLFNPDRTIHVWKHHETKIKLKLNQQSGKIKLAFYYVPISAKVNLKQQEELEAVSSRSIKVDKERAVQALDLMQF